MKTRSPVKIWKEPISLNCTLMVGTKQKAEKQKPNKHKNGSSVALLNTKERAN